MHRLAVHISLILATQQSLQSAATVHWLTLTGNSKKLCSSIVCIHFQALPCHLMLPNCTHSEQTCIDLSGEHLHNSHYIFAATSSLVSVPSRFLSFCLSLCLSLSLYLSSSLTLPVGPSLSHSLLQMNSRYLSIGLSHSVSRSYP